MADAVTIEPGMPFEELASLFRSADLVVYPSYYEGPGLIPSRRWPRGPRSSLSTTAPCRRWWTRAWAGCSEWATPMPWPMPS
ncbi:MAG: hypothetical protein Ct9H300mP30_0650 [Methanobacteriota archaeon]|nr:MAG: hypothetical protein Ct9H300mP30_0650 [Euryarchaeota archaeon]